MPNVCKQRGASSHPNGQCSSCYHYECFDVVCKTIHDQFRKYIRYQPAGEVRTMHLSLLRQLMKLLQTIYLPNYVYPYSIHLSLMKALILQYKSVLVLCFKYRSPNSLVYKTVFGGITQLTVCHAQALKQTIKEFYNKHKININRLVMLTSDGATVMLDRWNELAALLKRTVPHL